MSRTRIIYKLKEVDYAVHAPIGPPKNVKGALGRGLAFERKFGRKLKILYKKEQIYSNIWLCLIDANGYGVAQPDFYVDTGHSVILFECKLTQTKKAWVQLYDLYKPLLSKLLHKPVMCVQVCKNLKYEPKHLIRNENELIDHGTWHWLGNL
jgi:hypothetical protein